MTDCPREQISSLTATPRSSKQWSLNTHKEHRPIQLSCSAFRMLYDQERISLRFKRRTRDLGPSTYSSIRIRFLVNSIVGLSLFIVDVMLTGKFSTAPSLTAGLLAASTAYRARFDRTFSLSSSSFSPAEISFARAITSNLVGGIGYFYGSSIVDREFAQQWDDEDEFSGGSGKSGKPELTEPRGLFTATPSRSFFPRGFYWSAFSFQQLSGLLIRYDRQGRRIPFARDRKLG